MTKKQKIVVIGGGYFGLYISWFLAKQGYLVKLYERETSPMSHASYHNQARVHQGYHYPRSVLTALRSQETFNRFVEEFPECIYRDFIKYYLIGKHLSKVTSSQFFHFFKRIGAPITRADGRIFNLVNKNNIEDCFLTQEYAFDSVKLKESMMHRVMDAGVEVNFSTEVRKVEKINKELVVSLVNGAGEQFFESAVHVFNCTYSGLNLVGLNSQIEIIPLKHELTEMALVKVPDILQHLGITVMCGPFFSVMPFPSVLENGLPLHSLSHVRYTPHYEWYDKDGVRGYKPLEEARHSAFKYMLNDAARYIPVVKEAQFRESLWEIKTVLPRSETDDSRPILCKFNHGLEGFHVVMGGKIDNVYDAVSYINEFLGG